MDLLLEASRKACVCDEKWIPAATALLKNNKIEVHEWRQSMLEAIEKGRKRGYIVTHVGQSGTEGKSFMLKPLYEVFGDQKVFITPTKGSFPLLGLEKARATLLDDWRFNEDILSYNLQLLWFEGAPFVIARPQNQSEGHVRYSKDDPVFISTLKSDLESAAGKKCVQEGDVRMMIKRLKIFEFTAPIEKVDDSIRPCPHCFARFLLFGPESGMTPRPGPPKRASSSTSRSPVAEGWNVEEVVGYVHEIGLGFLEGKIRESAVDGRLLVALDVSNLVECLEVTKLQAMKILQRLP